MTTWTERDLEENYRAFLDEVYGTVTIAGHVHDTSRALKELDPDAFRTGMHNHADYMLRNGTLTIEGYES